MNTADTSTAKESAVLAGGCFWGVEDLIRKIPGVLNTEVGYAGGSKSTASYKLVSQGDTDHAEALAIEFDPKKVSFETILDHFFRLHDPTTENRQGNDVGTQYRSVIFYKSSDQKASAHKIIEKVNASKKWLRPVVTQVVPFTEFFPAEDYHQDYLLKNPDGYTCHFYRK